MSTDADDYELVRARSRCFVCGAPKLPGPVMCAACHRFETEANDGQYGKDVLARLGRLEHDLGGSER